MTYHVIVKIWDKNGQEKYTYVNLDYISISKISLQEVEKDALKEINENHKEVVGITYIDPSEFLSSKYLPINPYN